MAPSSCKIFLFCPLSNKLILKKKPRVPNSVYFPQYTMSAPRVCIVLTSVSMMPDGTGKVVSGPPVSFRTLKLIKPRPAFVYLASFSQGKPTGFELQELAGPYYAFKRAGLAVQVNFASAQLKSQKLGVTSVLFLLSYSFIRSWPACSAVLHLQTHPRRTRAEPQRTSTSLCSTGSVVSYPSFFNNNAYFWAHLSAKFVLPLNCSSSFRWQRPL